MSENRTKKQNKKTKQNKNKIITVEAQNSAKYKISMFLICKSMIIIEKNVKILIDGYGSARRDGRYIENQKERERERERERQRERERERRNERENQKERYIRVNREK